MILSLGVFNLIGLSEKLNRTTKRAVAQFVSPKKSIVRLKSPQKLGHIYVACLVASILIGFSTHFSPPWKSRQVFVFP